MAAARGKSDEGATAVERVCVPFAYPRAKSGEVVMLTKGDVIDPARFAADSLEHLRSIEFIGFE